MSISGDYGHAPTIDYRQIAGNEQDVCFQIGISLTALYGYTIELEAAVELFIFSRERLNVRMAANWESGAPLKREDGDIFLENGP